MKTAILLIAGWLCILAGAAGLVLPLVPGIPLLITGAVLLSRHHHWARRLLARVRKTFPDFWHLGRSQAKRRS
ncbi:MAG TPA: PGPGW domain-containing protein [Candidatus Angelobacter sp.]|nr:PGPGW domain-containing protein [Candidatus Angelobacter sp.]